MTARKMLTRFFGIFFISLLLAELVSRFFLPVPAIHKLPGVKFIADKDCGYIMAPKQKAYTLGSRATINQWGFRGKDWSLKKNEGTQRVAVLGSSYGFGHGVGDEEFFPAQLEAILNRSKTDARYEVMSFGVGGYDTGHEYNVFKKYALQFEPDILVVAFFMNDLLFIKDYGFYAEMFAIQEKNFSRFQWELRNLFRHSRLLMFLWDYLKDFRGRTPSEVEKMFNAYSVEGVMPPSGPNAEGWSYVTEKLKAINQLAKQSGMETILIVIPTHQEMLNPKANPRYVGYLEKIASEEGMGFIPVLKLFKDSGKDPWDYMIPYDFHLSKEGHRVMAEAIAEKING